MRGSTAMSPSLDSETTGCQAARGQIVYFINFIENTFFIWQTHFLINLFLDLIHLAVC